MTAIRAGRAGSWLPPDFVSWRGRPPCHRERARYAAHGPGHGQDPRMSGIEPGERDTTMQRDRRPTGCRDPVAVRRPWFDAVRTPPAGDATPAASQPRRGPQRRYGVGRECHGARPAPGSDDERTRGSCAAGGGVPASGRRARFRWWPRRRISPMYLGNDHAVGNRNRADRPSLRAPVPAPVAGPVRVAGDPEARGHCRARKRADPRAPVRVYSAHTRSPSR